MAKIDKCNKCGVTSKKRDEFNIAFVTGNSMHPYYWAGTDLCNKCFKEIKDIAKSYGIELLRIEDINKGATDE